MTHPHCVKVSIDQVIDELDDILKQFESAVRTESDPEQRGESSEGSSSTTSTIVQK
ncbi:MAG: hypothetical protein ACOYKZ_00005 [Chlamydiia bacterium]